MDNLGKKSRVYKPAPSRYRDPGPTNEQSGDVARKKIRINEHELEVFYDCFDDEESKESETEDECVVMQSLIRCKKSFWRVKRTSAFSSSSEDESLKMFPVEKKSRVMVVDIDGKVMDRDEVDRFETELERRRSVAAHERQLEFILPRPIDKPLGKRLSSTSINKSQNNAIFSPNITEVRADNTVLIEPKRKRKILVSARTNRAQLVENTLKTSNKTFLHDAIDEIGPPCDQTCLRSECGNFYRTRTETCTEKAKPSMSSQTQNLVTKCSQTTADSGHLCKDKKDDADVEFICVKPKQIVFIDLESEETEKKK